MPQKSPSILDRFGRPVALAASEASFEDPRDRKHLAPTAPRQHFRDLPIAGTSVFDEVDHVKASLRELERGFFAMPAQLAESMISDDRLEGIVQTRVDALFSLPLEIEPRGDGRRANAVAEEVRGSWEQMFPQEELKQVLRWGLMLKYAPSELVWNSSGDRWTPRLKCWNPRHSYWRWDTRSYQMVTMDGTERVLPGDGRWVVYTPNGYERGWVYGLVRTSARLFLLRQFSYRDWARWSEVHGLPIRVGVVPSGAAAKTKDAFIQDLLNIGRDTAVRAERDENDKGFDIKLVEAASQSWEGFQKLVAAVDENAAVLWLGQNLTTSVKAGGSYAAANVHDRIRQDRLEADAKSLGPMLREQALRPWALYNFGDAELAPDVGWSTKAPEDRAATAKTFVDAGTALAAWRSSGVNVDRVEYAKRFGMPVDEKDPLKESLVTTMTSTPTPGAKPPAVPKESESE